MFISQSETTKEAKLKFERLYKLGSFRFVEHFKYENEQIKLRRFSGLV